MHALNITLRFFAGMLACVVVLELVLQALPVSTATRSDYYVDPYINTYPPNGRFFYSSGWDLRQGNAQKVNSVGFASSVERTISLPGLALVGDSFIEGAAVPEPLRITERLREFLPDFDPIMLGTPGTSLLDYLDRARWARTRLNADSFVFFVGVDDGNDALCGSGQHLRRCFNRQTQKIEESDLPIRTKAKDFFSQFAVLQYFLGHLKLSSDSLKRAMFPQKKVAGPARKQGALQSPTTSVALEHFLSTLDQMRPARVMIVLDCDRTALYAGQGISESESYTALKALNARYSIPIVETCDRFKQRFERDRLRTEVSFSDTHWNARGHDIIGELVAESWRKHFPTP